MLAATIAVGGFIGVPGMIYVLGASGLVASATELVIAFVMGFGGTIKWAMHGMVDIRLTLIILAGSLLGVQLGAIGTTYVKEHMIKIVMGTIMLIVAVSRGLAVPQYLNELKLISMGEATLSSWAPPASSSCASPWPSAPSSSWGPCGGPSGPRDRRQKGDGVPVA